MSRLMRTPDHRKEAEREAVAFFDSLVAKGGYEKLTDRTHGDERGLPWESYCDDWVNSPIGYYPMYRHVETGTIMIPQNEWVSYQSRPCNSERYRIFGHHAAHVVIEEHDRILAETIARRAEIDRRWTEITTVPEHLRDVQWTVDDYGPDWNLPNRPVLVCGPHTKYTAEELDLLMAFGREYQEVYDHRYGGRIYWDTAFIAINKDTQVAGDGRQRTSWHRRSTYWNSGPMWSPSLPEAIGVFLRNRHFSLGNPPTKFWLLRSGAIVELVAAPEGEWDHRWRPLGSEVSIRVESTDRIIVGDSLDELAERVFLAFGHRIDAMQIDDPADRGHYRDLLARAREAHAADADPAILTDLWAQRPRSFDDPA